MRRTTQTMKRQRTMRDEMKQRLMTRLMMMKMRMMKRRRRRVRRGGGRRRRMRSRWTKDAARQMRTRLMTTRKMP
jgi:hypothetical protein